MLTNHDTSPSPTGLGKSTFPVRAGVQKVAIVNGNPEILTLVESVLNAGHYDVVFIESVAHAYSHIKRVQPNLVILCVRLENMDAFQVLSMLKLDEETRGIPVLTYTAGYEGQDQNEETDEAEEEAPEGPELFSMRPSNQMN